jgi:hypothetical protein
MFGINEYSKSDIVELLGVLVAINLLSYQFPNVRIGSFIPTFSTKADWCGFIPLVLTQELLICSII